MTSPVTNNTINNTAVTSSVTSNTTNASSTTNGLSSAASSLQSAATSSAASQGICSKLSQWLCKCLSYLPFIGKFFNREPATANTTQSVVPPQTEQRMLMDAEKARSINEQFVARGAAGASSATVPNTDRVVRLFEQISCPNTQMSVFFNVLNAANASVETIKQLFDKLPTDSKEKIKYEAFVANGSNANVDGVDVVNFGQYFADHLDRFGAHLLVAVNAVLHPRRAPMPIGQQLTNDTQRVAFITNEIALGTANDAQIHEVFLGMDNVSKIQVMHCAMASARTTEAMVKQMYANLGTDMQVALRNHIFEANGQSLTVNGHLAPLNDVGRDVIDNGIKTTIAQQGALRFLNALRA